MFPFILSIYLNTSYVDIKLSIAFPIAIPSAYLNTSYVDIKPDDADKLALPAEFKYILC